MCLCSWPYEPRSQARHGKKKRLEETLNIGFDIESEDEMGNTLLLIAVQQTKVTDLPLSRPRPGAIPRGRNRGN